jgi:hypothetical protein
MAFPVRRPTPDECELGSLSDIQFLHAFAELVSREQSPQAKALALEMMRRYTACLGDQTAELKQIRNTLGSARWGDALQVEKIFGIKRGPLDRLRKAGRIDSSSLDDDPIDRCHHAVRAKRLFDLVSIMRCVEAAKDRNRIPNSQTAPQRVTKTKLKLMKK